jgi:hypothetical protein
MWSSCSLAPIHGLTDPACQPFASHLGDSNSRPGDALTLTLELGFPVSDVPLHAIIIIHAALHPELVGKVWQI